MAVWPTGFAAVLGVAIGSWLPVPACLVVLRRARAEPEHAPGPGQVEMVRELAHSSQPLLAFFILSNADMVVGRSLLPAQAVGICVGGLILGKAVLFPPQFFILLVAFPVLAQSRYWRSRCSQGSPYSSSG